MADNDLLKKEISPRKIHNRIKFILILTAVLAVVFGAVAAFVMHNSEDAKKVFSNGTETETEETAIGGGKLNKTVMLYCTDSQKEKMRFLVLANIKLPENEITFISFDPTTVINNDGNPFSLESCYKNSGPAAVAKALEKFSSIKIDRYIGSNEESFKTAVNRFGGVYMKVDEEVRYKDGDFSLTLTKGDKQKLNGYDLLRYLRYMLVTGNLKGQAEVMAKAFEYILGVFDVTTVDSTFTFMSNLLESDIGITAFSPVKAQLVQAVSQADFTYIIVSDKEEFLTQGVTAH